MKQVHTVEQALAYMADCTLATVDDYAMKKRPPVREYRRQRLIAQSAVDWMQKFGVSAERTRAEDVIKQHNGSVDAYAEAIRTRHNTLSSAGAAQRRSAAAPR